MLLETLKSLFNRDLNRLKKEIESYTSEEKIWIIDKQIANSSGNLCLHIAGNLNTYIGKELGGINYIRNRDQEFSLKYIPRTVLVKKITGLMSIIDQVLSKLDESELSKEYPLFVLDTRTSTEYMLVHLATHLAYHLGQVNYHRRLLDSE
ncbi:DUF1572 family protein [Flavisolibacter ginsengisoli]|jgi:uncharacterized damage-inducible protein DinB|uniref:DinB superfamily protein n=1 Tax=Flavisolibacter ginsengisoli DSM 18119 TaxID=1121884 RepID=A0A1M4SYP9_9BACT|nr:DUF1572 family protein [Flavisolibacter ginsengisoli]SHE37315.1 Protein of unknown function [Flavisolibacter ginsengisoli DSM 18119]